MYKVRTSVDNKKTAQMLSSALVESHAAVSVHIRKVESLYAWKGKIENIIEYEVEALCINPSDAYTIIVERHPYELPEFIVTDIGASDGIEDWCKDWCRKE